MNAILWPNISTYEPIVNNWRIRNAHQNKEKPPLVLEAHALRRTAFVLVTIGLLWNLVEAVVAFWAGFQTSSIAILAFGLDSIVELFAGGVLVWRLTTHLGEEEAEAAEQRAQRLVGFTFFLLAFYILLHSGANLAGWLPEPQPSIAGVAIVVASAVVMAILYIAKMRIATRMQSHALRAEAMESLFCDLQDVSILIGLGLNALFSWWWADPVSALILVPFFIKEGLENLSGGCHHDDPNSPQVCFCHRCTFGLRPCPALCCHP